MTEQRRKLINLSPKWAGFWVIVLFLLWLILLTVFDQVGILYHPLDIYSFSYWWTIPLVILWVFLNLDPTVSLLEHWNVTQGKLGLGIGLTLLNVVVIYQILGWFIGLLFDFVLLGIGLKTSFFFP